MPFDYHSPANQEILREFAFREVLANITDMGNELFFNGCGSYADFESFHNVFTRHCPHCGEETGTDRESHEASWVCPHCGESFPEPPEEEMAEPLQFWIVTPFLGEKLEEAGECVLPRANGWIWARQCCGQSIYMDWVIGKIGESLGLLKA